MEEISLGQTQVTPGIQTHMRRQRPPVNVMTKVIIDIISYFFLLTDFKGICIKQCVYIIVLHGF